MKSKKGFKTTKKHIYSPLEDFHPSQLLVVSSNIPFSLTLLGPSWSQAGAKLADKKMSAILVSNSGIIIY